MKETLKIINRLQKKGLIGKYAIGGGIAAIYYIETILTYDLYILFIPVNEKNDLISLEPIYKFLKAQGCKTKKEHIMIEGIPVQMIPVYNNLVREAVQNAKEIKYKKVKTWVIGLEYLSAIMLQTYRPKDKESLIKIFTETPINKKKLMYC
ncbi:hypothetical protein KAU33_12105 [Candidatus Dependentiae bacterium]|nr:hypothetical protein [Candidatus Dependentiae bacterium]